MPAHKQSTSRDPGLRVFLVEDENLVALLLEDALAELGHTVLGPVARLTRALEMARREAFDVAILDVNINGEASYPIADVLAARGIPFIFSTGYGRLSPQYRNRPTLEKPFRLQDLQRSLADVLS